MRRFSVLPLLGLLAAVGCGDDSGTGVPTFSYTLNPPVTPVSVGQDSSVQLDIIAVRGANDTITFAKTAAVTLTAGGFAPAAVFIDAGGTVTFANLTGASHGVDFVQSIQDIPNTTASVAVPRLFNTPGVYEYRCPVHTTISSANVITGTEKGTVTVYAGARPTYTSGDLGIVTVDAGGIISGVSGGTTTINVRLGTASIDVPVTVRPRPATLVQLSFLTGPAGGALLAGNPDVGEFYALPADNRTSRLKGLVMVGTDTVFCNYCAQPDTARFPRRTMRVVRFRSLDPELATVTNASNPKLQTSSDTSGRVTPLDTATAGVRIVMEVPGDSGAAVTWADTVLAKLSLRPLDTLRIRPDSNFFPTANGTGLSKQIYPNSDTLQANVVAATTTNFIAGLDFLSRVQDPPTPGTGAAGTVRWIVARIVGGPEVFRPSLPSVTWESANSGYLQVNAAGAITAQCAQIGGNCPAPATPSTWLLTCNSTSGAMPADFAGEGTYTVPNCATPRLITPYPGAICTTTNSNDLSSTCTIWVRASAIDPATGKLLRRLYRINIRR